MIELKSIKLPWKNKMNQENIIEIGSMNLELLPEKVAIDHESKRLFVADVHFGKDAWWRKNGQYLPEVGLHDLNRLNDVACKYQVKEVFALGDFIHSTETDDFKYLAEFLQAQTANYILIAGNHDRHSAKDLKEMNINIFPTLELENVTLVHNRSTVEVDKPFFAGHEHPGIKIPGEGTLPAFVKIDNGLVFPAFGSTCNSMSFNKIEHKQAWVIGEGEIVKL